MFLRQVSSAIRRNIVKYSTEAVQENANPPVKKETLIQQWKRFWKFLYADYKDVAIGVIEESRAKPKKVSFYFGVIGATIYAINTNPDEIHFRQAILQATDDLAMVSDLNRNPATEKFLTRIHSAYNEGIIRRLSLGPFSLIWLHNYDEKCAVYPSQCDYMKPGVLDFHTRIVDVGCFGRWWNIHRYMTDYDINHAEFQSVPQN